MWSYDPSGFNDRLLLGLKGTMSEAELHILKARMRGGQLNKARRGELEMGPPVGLVYRTDGTIGLDPDAQGPNAIRLVFETFERTGSAVQTVRFFRNQGLLFPRRLRTGSNKGDLLWASPNHSRILQVLHNPRYAGAFAYAIVALRRLYAECRVLGSFRSEHEGCAAKWASAIKVRLILIVAPYAKRVQTKHLLYLRSQPIMATAEVNRAASRCKSSDQHRARSS